MNSRPNTDSNQPDPNNPQANSVNNSANGLNQQNPQFVNTNGQQYGFAPQDPNFQNQSHEFDESMYSNYNFQPQDPNSQDPNTYNQTPNTYDQSLPNYQPNYNSADPNQQYYQDPNFNYYQQDPALYQNLNYQQVNPDGTPILQDQNLPPFQNYQTQLDSLYQQSPDLSSTSDENLSSQPPIFEQAAQQLDGNGYSSVTYPQSNFMDYKSVYNDSSDPANQIPGSQPDNFAVNQNSDFNQAIDPNNYADYNQVTPPFDGQPVDNQENPEQNNSQQSNLENVANYEAVNQEITPPPVNEIQNFEQSAVKPLPNNNRRFYIISGIIIFVLLTVLSVASFITYRQINILDQNGSSSSSTSQSSQPSEQASSQEATNPNSQNSQDSVQINFTDPNGPTPASVAKKNEAKEIPSDWLKQKFSQGLNDSGNCDNQEICGTNADFDKDGLPNIEEYNYQTTPQDTDTDKDGISDGDEIKIYSTDPTKKDSTNNGIDDFDELKSCFDPALRPNSLNNKLSTEKKNQISQNLNQNKFHEPTITNFKKSGASATDLEKGWIENTCGNVSIDL